jgi:hypothetical protein
MRQGRVTGSLTSSLDSPGENTSVPAIGYWVGFVASADLSEPVVYGLTNASRKHLHCLCWGMAEGTKEEV